MRNYAASVEGVRKLVESSAYFSEARVRIVAATIIFVIFIVIFLNSNKMLNFISERELMFMFAICRRPSLCRLSVVCRLSVTFVHPTQPIEIFGNFSAPFNTLVT